FLTLGGERRALTQIAWETGFDPISNRFTIDRFAFDAEGARGNLNGEVSISFGDDIRDPESISFSLASDEIVIDAPTILPGALPVTSLSVDGQYILPERRLSLANLAAEFAGLTAGGSVTFRLPRGRDGASAPSPGVIADIDFQGALGPESLLSVWPKGLAMGARDWIVDRLETAYIDNLDFEMNLAPGAVAEDGGLPDEALTLTFDARDVKAYYVKEMTPLRDGAGSGVLRGNSFLLNVRRAQVGDVPISAGEVSFPIFMPKWRPTYYRFSAEGEAQSMLAILDEAPLSLLSKVNLSADQFSGTARADVEIMRPNKREVAPEEYGYTGTATFEDMSIAELIGDINFSSASGTVDLQTRSMKVTADALLADDAPINLQWRQNFYEQDGPSDVAITGVFDSSTGDLFGVSTRQFLRGPVMFEANATGDLGDFETLDVKADFADAALIVDALGWRKPAGGPAAGDISMAFNEAGVEVSRLSLKGDGLDIDGGLSFDKSGAIEAASLPRFFLRDAADFSVTAERDPMGALEMTAVGAFLNAGPLIQQTLEGSDGQESSLEWGRGVHVRSRIDEVAMRGGISYRDGALDLHRDADRLQALDFSAFGEDGNPLSVSMALTGADEGPERAVEARSSAIGELMRGIFGIDSVAGGEGSMRIALHQEGAPGFSGELEARNLQVINAPLLARIFSAGSLDGLVNLMNGEGIEFSYAYGNFDYADGVVAVKDMRATGSSVGITAEGDLSVGGDDETNLTGAVAPIYALNSVLGNAPIIGDILVGTRGEGIVAFNYRVSGDIGNPSVFVNPLSALTPGIFRELFQPSRTSGRGTVEESAPSTDE
ncbi:MAG: AsmA-like C-terminal domain-containing protein, partial [Pseudomonadota bacterium]